MTIIAVTILGALATYRVTRLVIEDDILTRPREYLFSKNNRTLSYFLTCPWCVSMWIAPVFALLYLTHPTAFFFATLTLAFSALTGILFTKV